MSQPSNSRAASRRKYLCVLATVPLALFVSAGCSNAISPRQYKRPRTHIVGGNGKRGRSGGARDGQ